DFRIADDLRRVQESRPLLRDGATDYQQRAAEYRTAFEKAGLKIDDAETAADSIRTSTIAAQLVAALDDRAFVAFMLKDESLVERLLRIAGSADREPRWRDRFRAPAAWKTRDQLLQLAAGAFNTSPAPPEHQLALLGLLLRQVGARNQCSQLLGEACRRQPRNFWVQREMGFELLLEKRWLESAGYYRAAVTLRPNNGAAHEGLGMALAP